MRRTTSRSGRTFVPTMVVSLAVMISTSAQADSTDVSVIFLNKTEQFRQTSTADPVLGANPFTFNLGVNASRTNSITSASYTPPGGTSTTLPAAGGGNFFLGSAGFTSVAALNAAFPNGTYNFALQTVTAPTAFNPSVTLTGDGYVTTVPKIINTTWANGSLQIDLARGSTFQWNGFAFQSAGNNIHFQINDANGATIFTRSFNTPTTSVSVPAGVLQAGQYYSASLNYQNGNFSSVGSTAISPAYLVATDFRIAAISGVPVLTSPGFANLTVGVPFYYQITATNNPASYGVGSLPPGLVFNSALGVISGTPTAVSNTQIGLTATNSSGAGFNNLTANVQSAPSSGPIITSSTSATGQVGRPFKFQVLTTGGTAAARLTASGLPAGLTIDAVTGLISGTPTAAGGFAVALSVSDSNGRASATLQLTITADSGYPVIISPNLAYVTRGQAVAYSIDVPVKDPLDPPVYTLLGTLPSGLSFDSKTGVISGTYTGSPIMGDGPPVPKPLSGGVIVGGVQLFVSNSHGTSTAPLIFLTPPAGAVNISTRMPVGTGDDVLIAGFIVTGNAPKAAIIRGIGPSLQANGTPLAGALQDPMLELHDDVRLLVSNDDWRSSQEQAIKDTTIPPTNDRESAIAATIQPGNYTAILTGKNSGTGIGLVEIYDLGTASPDGASKAQLAQISTRGKVLGGDKILIGGFIISGVTTKVLLRAIGPELTTAGVAGALKDTTLELHDGTGALLAANDDWRTSQETEINNTGVPPKDDRESAIVTSLPPGAYTAIVRGKNDTTGVALVEIYSL